MTKENYHNLINAIHLNKFIQNNNILLHFALYRHLQDELEDLKEKGVPEEEDRTCGRVCRRCRSPLGVVVNSGALCISCSRVVCNSCRVETNVTSPERRPVPSWVCTVCGKIRYEIFKNNIDRNPDRETMTNCSVCDT